METSVCRMTKFNSNSLSYPWRLFCKIFISLVKIIHGTGKVGVVLIIKKFDPSKRSATVWYIVTLIITSQLEHVNLCETLNSSFSVRYHWTDLWINIILALKLKKTKDITIMKFLVYLFYESFLFLFFIRLFGRYFKTIRFKK